MAMIRISVATLCACLAAAGAAASGARAAELIFETSFEREDPVPWAVRPNGGGHWNIKGTGTWLSLGQDDYIQLVVNGVAHSGTNSIRHMVKHNEARGQAYCDLDQGYDDLYVRQYVYFTCPGGKYDHGTGAKIGRFYSARPSGYKNLDVVLVAGSWQDASRGADSNRSLSLHYNGPPDMPDWGALYTGVVFEDNRWYCIECHVKLNTPGQSDGLVEIFVDGEQRGRKENLNIRADTDHKFNRLLAGGWWSNGGSAECTPPADGVQYRYIDDFAVSTNYIGPIESGALAAPKALMVTRP